ncbi:hypothetical protein CLERM_605 [Coxiella-like endosymbiont]|nr:hypothetical protein CLERM_605 [Coxiella-like endosymbiont]PMB54960.1 hypothetical protein CLERM_048 [Coxiella-like endosymbiont]
MIYLESMSEYTDELLEAWIQQIMATYSQKHLPNIKYSI